MMQRRLTRTLSLAASLLLVALLAYPKSASAEPKLAWETKGFDGPESIVLDDDAGVLYLSNVNGGATDANGKGYISKLSPKGEIVEKEWVTGLNAPKGLSLHDGKLYVADIDKVAVIDTKTGEITDTYDAPGAKFLNDVSAHNDGRVFISDMLTNQIWLLEDGKLSVWVEGTELDYPNGVLAEDDTLYIASWGEPKDDFSTDVPGKLKSVDYETKTVTPLGDKPIGNLDGLERDGKGGFFVTDWFNGGLYRISENGEAELLMDMKKGSADHLVTDGGKLVIIPMMLDGTVAAYEVQ